jgi:hypothetical protein
VKPSFSIAPGTAFLRICLMMILAGWVVACTPRISPPVTVAHLQLPADFPEAYYRQTEAAGSKVLRVDSNRSLVTVLVRRGGALARLGHDHVIASHDVTGYVDMTGGRADLYVPLQSLAVDEAELRSQAGLSKQVALDAIEGTRRNMLDKVLEAESFPFALIRITRAKTDLTTLHVSIALHGSMRTFEVPAQIESMAGGLKITGQMTFNQTDFGMTPFSILAGALQVQDRLNLSFSIFAASPS